MDRSPLLHRRPPAGRPPAGRPAVRRRCRRSIVACRPAVWPANGFHQLVTWVCLEMSGFWTPAVSSITSKTTPILKTICKITKHVKTSGFAQRIAQKTKMEKSARTCGSHALRVRGGAQHSPPDDCNLKIVVFLSSAGLRH